MKLSNSGVSRFLECPRSFKLHYETRLRSLYKSSALIFGAAIDQGLNEILAGKSLDEAKATFVNHWTINYDYNDKPFEVSHYPYVTYSDSDFDFDLLTKKDFAIIHENYSTVSDKIGSNIFEILNYVKDRKRELGSVRQIDVDILIHYNLINWCVLKNKGQLMIEAYYNQILPNFKQIIDIQKTVNLDSACGDSINGVVDLVAELDNGIVAIIDNKTAAWDYDADSVKTSQQLTMYKIILNNLYNDGLNKYKVDKCGYAVIKKKPIKNTEKVCKSCGFKGEGRHETCNNMIEGKRCGGEWDKKVSISFETQFIVDDITEHQEDIVFETINMVTELVNKKVYLPNMNACVGKFGKCVFFDYCHNKSEAGLIILPDKETEFHKVKKEDKNGKKE